MAIINGVNFKDIVSIKFGIKKATTGFAIGTKQLIVIAPPQKAGTYPVTVETKVGVSNSNFTFTYKKLF